MEVRLQNSNELYHHGILGQKWGVRRYQDLKGSLTKAGELRYGIGMARNGVSKLTKRSVANLNSKWVDTLDKYNRKGYLDWLDKKADAPFKSIRKSKYVSSSERDPFRAIQNLERYLDIDAYSKTDTPETRGGAYKRREQEIYSKMLDSYNSKYSDIGKKWSDAIRKRTGQSVLDKQLGMISKDARDKAREKAGLDFVKDMSKKGWNVNDITKRWYNTDEYGRKKQFTGQQYEETYGTTLKPKWKDVVIPESVSKRTFRYFRMPGDTREGLMGRGSIDSKDNDTLYRWQKKYDPDYGHDVEYVDIPSWYRKPEERKTIRDGWKEVPTVQIHYDKPTKDYADYLAKSKLPNDYSNITDSYTRSFADSAQQGMDWLYGSSATHSDIKEVFMGEDLADTINSIDTSVSIDSELYHYGTKGQKWGLRRYQNKDGSLTPAGKEHYGIGKRISNTASAIKKKLNPSKTDLDEKLAKAEHKRDIRAEKQQIKDTNKQFKRKSLKNMSNDEITAAMERLALEKNYKEMKKSANTSRGKEAFKNAIQNAANRAAANAIENIAGAVAQKVARSIAGDNQYKLAEREAQLQLNYLDDREKHSDRRSKSGDLLSDYYELMGKHPKNKNNNRNDNQSEVRKARENAEDDLKLRILNGDKEAAKRYKKYQEATQQPKKGKQNPQQPQQQPQQPKSKQPQQPKPKQEPKQEPKQPQQPKPEPKQERSEKQRDTERAKEAIQKASNIVQQNAQRQIDQARASQEQQRKANNLVRQWAKHKYDKRVANPDGTYTYVYDDAYREWMSQRLS